MGDIVLGTAVFVTVVVVGFAIVAVLTEWWQR